MKKNQTFFKFLNILADEIKQLKKKIKIFNTQIMIINNHIINISDDEKMILADNIKLFSIITNYIKAVDDDFYNEINSVLCISISVWLYVFFFFLLCFFNFSCFYLVNLLSIFLLEIKHFWSQEKRLITDSQDRNMRSWKNRMREREIYNHTEIEMQRIESISL